MAAAVTDTMIIQAAVLVALLAVSGFCSGSEAVFFSLDALRLRRIAQAHPALGRSLHALLGQPTRLLSTILILNTLVNVVASALFFEIMNDLTPRYAEKISIVAMTVLLLIFGEFGPKQLALQYTARFAGWFTRPMQGAVWIMTPFRWALERVTRALQPFFRPRGGSLSGDEFRTVVDISGQEGIIDAEELSLIKAVVGLESMVVADIMTPRVDLRGVDLNDAAADPVRIARTARRQFLPLFRDTPDSVEGFLDVRRFLLDPAHSLDAARVTPYFVPSSMRLNRLLAQFQKDRRRVAVVVDEFGGTSGVVTRGDILERITGEIYHELSRPRPVFQEAGPSRWLVDAGFSLEDLNRKLDIRLEADGAERLAGWLSVHAGHIPEPNEIIEAQGCRVTVLKTDQRRVTLAHIEKLDPGEDDA